MDITATDRKEATKFGMQLFVITGHKDSSKGAFCSNLRIGIAATTLEEALAAATKKYPGARWLNVSHQGPIEVVVNK